MVKKIIGGVEYEVIHKNLPIRSLKFYIENPRVYSYFDRSEHDPSQEEMEEVMCNLDDVKELKGTIEKNGAILVPLIVKDGDFTVIEGNRRLAAARMLSKKDPMKWSTVPCELFPADLTDDAIFRILSTYHLNGQKKWAPFEEASLIYRRIKETGKSFKDIAECVGRPQSEIKHCYEVYEFMVKVNDLSSEHWSYYEEYLKNKSIKKIRSRVPDLDRSVSTMIISGQIKDAKGDIREKMGKIAKLPETKAIESFSMMVNNEKSLDEISNEIESLNVDVYRSINTFRTKIMDPSTDKAINILSDSDIQKYVVELRMIQTTIEQILKKLDKKEN